MHAYSGLVHTEEIQVYPTPKAVTHYGFVVHADASGEHTDEAHVNSTP